MHLLLINSAHFEEKMSHKSALPGIDVSNNDKVQTVVLISFVSMSICILDFWVYLVKYVMINLKLFLLRCFYLFVHLISLLLFFLLLLHYLLGLLGFCFFLMNFGLCILLVLFLQLVCK